MNEFDLIRAYFTHHSDQVVLGVGDDAAIVAPTPGCELLVSTDMLVEGRHFFADVDPYALGHKCLAVNVSDMAAMGARPRWAFLSLALPGLAPQWLSAFADGFMTLANRFGVALAGGDTTRGPLTLSVTIIGEVPQGQALRRDGGKAGDDVWVSGRVGMAALAVKTRLEGLAGIPDEVLAVCRAELDYPEPRVALGQSLRGMAHAAIDVSDGVLADVGHIADRSGLGVEIHFDALPTHPWLAERRGQWLECLTGGGDEYELCFTAPVAERSRIAALATEGCPLTRVGSLVEQGGVRLLAADGSVMETGRIGYDHFAA